MALTGGGPAKSVAEFKKLFIRFDRVMTAAERGKLKALSKFGAFVRRRAQTSMRRRKRGVSAPGTPPFAKKGLLKKLLFFAYDPASDSVLVGPAAINKSPVPNTHEFGGLLGRRRTRKDGTRSQKTVRYPARPFMKPALDAELPKFADCFRGSIGG